MNWLDTNLIPAWNNEGWSVISGGATITSGAFTLPVDSSIRLQLTTGNIIKASGYLRLSTKFNGNFADTDGYTPNCNIAIKITYLDGTIQNTNMVFSKYQTDTDGDYLDITEIAVEPKGISTFEMYLVNKSTAIGILTIYNIELYKSSDVNADQVADTVTSDIQIVSVPRYDNGCIINFTDGTMKKIEIIMDDTDPNEFIGILVNDETFIESARIVGNLP